ncbi:MAG: PAS domain-containing protein, partial [Planctomycetota bacterium]|nr:PAS domain-containing protein [Planctomycetota bacterium]
MKTAPSFPVSVLLALGVFALDLGMRELPSAETVLYLWPVWVAARTGDLRWTLVIALSVSSMAVIGELSERDPMVGGLDQIFSVRGFVLFSIWGTVLTVLPLIQAKRQLLQSQANLLAEADVQRMELVQVRQEKTELETEAERALRDSEALYHSLVDHLPLSVLRKDREFRYSFVNRRFLEFAGADLGDVLGKTDFDLFPKEMAEKYRAGDERVLSSGLLFNDVETYQRSDGEQRWIEVLKSPVYDAQHHVTGMQIVVSDVTDRKRAELALANSKVELESRNRELQQSQSELQRQTDVLESILRNIADGVVVANEHGEFLRWNPAAERIIGIGATETRTNEWAAVYGLFLPDGKTPHPPEQLPLARAIRGEQVENGELFVRNAHRPEGALISVNGMPLRYDDGRIRGGVVVFRDVTELKRAEAEIRA